MMATTTPTLFIHDDGRISCPDHLGASAAAVLERRPGARLLRTPLGTWQRLTAADIEDLQSVGLDTVCEICEARARRSPR